MRVLVIDGNPNIAQVLSSYVRLLGYGAVETNDGREAIRQLQNTRYDLVITDSEIPSIDGAELCRIIKSHFHAVYIIGMSGYMSSLTDLERAGADFCLSKPFDLDELKNILERLR